MQRLRFSRYFKSLMIFIDIIVFAAVFLFFYLKQHDFKISVENYEENLLPLIILVFFWLLLGGRTKLYNIPRTLTYTNYLERLISHIFIFIFGIFLLAKVIDNQVFNENKLIIAVILFVALFFIKSLIFFFLKFIRLKGYNYRNVMFLGDNSSSEVLKERIAKRKDYGYKVFDYDNKEINLNNLADFWKKNGIHTLFITSENSFDSNFENEIFQAAELNKIRVVIIPRFSNNKFFSHEIQFIESQPILTPVKFPLDYYSNSFLKRTFDIAFSLLFLIFIGLWLFPVLAILIKLNSKGSVFFVQDRYGYHDEVFRLIKFRTMFADGNSNKTTTFKGDPRITSVGKFLRKTSLDETPQFINVLLGNMSVVGPRPHMLLVDNFFKPQISRYSVRSMVKPGITGLAQVNGLRGDKDDMKIEMEKRILADSFYVKNWSFTLDLIIIFKTLVLMIEGDKNAH